MILCQVCTHWNCRKKTISPTRPHKNILQTTKTQPNLKPCAYN